MRLFLRSPRLCIIALMVGVVMVIEGCICRTGF